MAVVIGDYRAARGEEIDDLGLQAILRIGWTVNAIPRF